jgi:hypothetical protein
MMFGSGFGCGNNYTDGDGEWCGYGYGVGIDGDGYGDGDGDGLGDTYMEAAEEEQLSAIRLLSDDTQDINFYICQLQLLKGRSP